MSRRDQDDELLITGLTLIATMSPDSKSRALYTVENPVDASRLSLRSLTLENVNLSQSVRHMPARLCTLLRAGTIAFATLCKLDDALDRTYDLQKAR